MHADRLVLMHVSGYVCLYAYMYIHVWVKVGMHLCMYVRALDRHFEIERPSAIGNYMDVTRRPI